MISWGIPAVDVLFTFIGFFVITVAASQLATVFPRIKLPLITGYLFVGILIGPFVLGFVTTDQMKDLSYINQFVLAFIGFSAGAELYLPELRELFRLILLGVVSISVITFSLVSTVVYLMMKSGVVPFVAGFSPACMLGISLLFGSIMTARSPASAIAIVKETRAKGPFTRGFLGITVVSDVVVLILFAVSVSITRANCDGKSFDLEALVALAVSLAFSILFGYFILGKILVFLLFLRPNSVLSGKWIILPLGFGLFLLSNTIADLTLEKFGHELDPEPLLMCIVGGYVATNQSKNRKAFLSMLQKVGPYVFIPFFTLTGASLNLKVLISSGLLAIVVALLRFFCIFLGSVIGGALAKAPKQHIIWMWMTLLTQAGVSLGLAGQIAFLFEWGPNAATMIVAVVMFNQIIGPILCKIAIKKVGEDGKAAAADNSVEGTRQALIFGIDGQSLALAARLQHAHWKVHMAAFDETMFKAVQTVNSRRPKSEHEEKELQEIEEIKRLEQEALQKKRKPAQTLMNFLLMRKEKHEEEEEEELYFDIETLLINPKEEAHQDPADEVMQNWDLTDLSSGFKLKTDVIVAMTNDDVMNSCLGRIYTKKGFKRVVCLLQDPGFTDEIVSHGALPFYMFSAAENTLFDVVTRLPGPTPANLAGIISPEKEHFREFLSLMGGMVEQNEDTNPDYGELTQPPKASSPMPKPKAANNNNSNPEIVVQPTGASYTSRPETKELPVVSLDDPNVEEQLVGQSGNATGMKKFTSALKSTFTQPMQNLDKIGKKINVVEDEHRDDYLHDLEHLESVDVKPVSSYSMFSNEGSKQRTEIEEVFQRGSSVFEEYHADDDDEHH